MKKLDNILCRMAICLLLLSFLYACNDNSVTSSLYTENGRAISTKHNGKKKVDWAMVAICDGGGACLGAAITKYSGNVYVIAATAVGIGVYASVEEYRRQDNCIVLDDILNYPQAINPYIPFQPIPLPNDSQYEINEKIYKTIGEAHNSIVQNLYHKYHIDNIADEKILYDALSQAQQFYKSHLDYSIEIDPDIYNLVIKHKENNWINETDTLLQYYPDALNLINNHPVEDLLAYIDQSAEKEKEQVSSEITMLSVAYYSKCLWNTIAPDPTVSQECMIWSKNNKELQYISGRSKVKDIIKNHAPDEYILFPTYDNNGIVALYLYTDKNRYGYSEYIDEIETTNSLHEESVFFKSIINISKGFYKVEPTTCNDVFIIRFK